MRSLLLLVPLLLIPLPPATAQVSMQIGVDLLPGVRLGIHLPVYPELERVPGYPVYVAPQAAGNYFYYDGLYWVLQEDDWYTSSWYNGPWRRVAPMQVPVALLQVPVRYYRQPPAYFSGWRADAPPRWGVHWGREWQQGRAGWDRVDRRRLPPPAPLPEYQRRYPQSRYPEEPTQQQAIRTERFGFRPTEPVARQLYQLPDRAAPRQGRGQPNEAQDRRKPDKPTHGRNGH